MKYLKSLIWIIGLLTILSLLFSTLYYFNIINTKIFGYIKLLIPIISFFTGGVYLGKHSKENGWLEGIKLGGVLTVLFFTISYLGFNTPLSLKNYIYYFLILFTIIFGSMIGIRNVEIKKSTSKF